MASAATVAGGCDVSKATAELVIAGVARVTRSDTWKRSALRSRGCSLSE
jgi:hypothetical protein